MTFNINDLFRREVLTCKCCGHVGDDYHATEKSGHVIAHCAQCGKYIKHISQADKYGTEEQQREIWDKTGGLCYYCGKPLRPYDKNGKMKLSTDHFVPQSKGGKHDTGNLVPCCKSCNSQKNNRLIGDYREYMKKITGKATHVFYFEVLEYGPKHISEILKKITIS